MATLKKGPHLDCGLGEKCQRDRAFSTLCNLKKLCLGCEEVCMYNIPYYLKIWKYSYKVQEILDWRQDSGSWRPACGDFTPSL